MFVVVFDLVLCVVKVVYVEVYFEDVWVVFGYDFGCQFCIVGL